ncbi:MAG: YggT family protein [Candidatus Eremiobacteraeota bacterium]|nr:YggT family protein [Candidatus Eremiobacteraeota bacterium]MBV8498008.1 YggT family protein [Candidatus Eremiobacteraeota bacterium]
MSILTCDLARLLYYAVNIYTLLMFVYAVLSWIPDLRRGRWVYVLGSIIEPVLQPIRRVIPPMGGLDLAFLIVLLVLQLLVRPALATLVFNSCVPLL